MTTTVDGAPGPAAKAVGEIARAQSVTPAVALSKLTALASVPRSDLAFLQAHGPASPSSPAGRALS